MAYDAALTALADPTRRRVFESLRRRPRGVSELARDVGISQPAASQHLAVLRRASLVRSRTQGAYRLYSPDPAGIAAVRGYFNDLWADVLEAYAASLEGEEN